MIDRPSSPDLTAELVTLLDLEPLDTDLFRGRQRPGASARVFGGQVAAQALMAAQRSVDGPAVAHSMHAYFLRAGAETHPIIFRVERDFDGRSFANRRVTASQRGATILTLAASFQRPEAGHSLADAQQARRQIQQALVNQPFADERAVELVASFQVQLVDLAPRQIAQHCG